jgi:hypothetical protein
MACAALLVVVIAPKERRVVLQAPVSTLTALPGERSRSGTRPALDLDRARSPGIRSTSFSGHQRDSLTIQAFVLVPYDRRGASTSTATASAATAVALRGRACTGAVRIVGRRKAKRVRLAAFPSSIRLQQSGGTKYISSTQVSCGGSRSCSYHPSLRLSRGHVPRDERIPHPGLQPRVRAIAGRRTRGRTAFALHR